jgi:all-trans-8'-apo-beta-carotenal 15,15'-oxygenase
MSDFAGNLFRRSLPREHGFQALQIEGKLPADLEGTLLRVGPGNFEIAGQPYAHPFDGDGVITALRVGAGGASGAVRLVRTAGLQEELAAGKILYGDAAAWWRRMRNLYSGREKRTPNVNLLAWQGRLFALNEGGGPVEIDPGDLETRGETDIDGAVSAAFCAHPHRVDARRTTYNVGLEYGPRTRMHVYAFPDAGPVQRLTTLTFSYAPLVHDFAATETHLIFFVSPVRLSMRGTFCSGAASASYSDGNRRKAARSSWCRWRSPRRPYVSRSSRSFNGISPMLFIAGRKSSSTTSVLRTWSPSIRCAPRTARRPS